MGLCASKGAKAMSDSGRSDAEPANFRDALRDFMEANGVRLSEKTRAPSRLTVAKRKAQAQQE